jgi:hypothetical protein
MVKSLQITLLLISTLCASCSRSESTMRGNIQPNAKRDLVINQSKKRAEGNGKPSKLNVKERIQFDITNRSESFTYNRISLMLYFRDKKGQTTDSTLQRFPIRLRPGQTKQVSYERSASTYSASMSTTAQVSTADYN